jgi:hypothetical protein
MTLRHAALLAFWLILAPPITGGQIDSTASLFKWHVYSKLFASEADCENIKRDMLNLASRADAQQVVKDRLKSMPLSTDHYAMIFAAERQSICVSSQDPRLSSDDRRKP